MEKVKGTLEVMGPVVGFEGHFLVVFENVTSDQKKGGKEKRCLRNSNRACRTLE